jgi:hypothetical protein
MTLSTRLQIVSFINFSDSVVFPSKVTDQLYILLDGVCLSKDLTWKLLQRPLGALDVHVRVWFGYNAIFCGRTRGRQRTHNIIHFLAFERGLAYFRPGREGGTRCTFSFATLVRLRYPCTTCLKSEDSIYRMVHASETTAYYRVSAY